MYPLRTIILATACTLALAACQTTGKTPAKSAAAPVDAAQASAIEITGESTTSMTTEPMVPTDPSVQTFPTEGSFENPLTRDRTHSVLDNTTAGGYTVFDESVTVYPLPGEDAPAYMPDYAVPPLMGQVKPQAPHVGQQPLGLASAGMLPPVPNVMVPDADPYAKPPVSGAVRQPLTLTEPEPLTMQPPSDARPPMKSPFGKATPIVDDVPATKGTPRAPKLTDMEELPVLPQGDLPMMTDAVPAAPVPAPAASPDANTATTSAGRRSSPLLTGY